MAGGVYPFWKRRLIRREHAIRTKSVSAKVTNPITANTDMNEGEKRSFIFKSHISMSGELKSVVLSETKEQKVLFGRISLRSMMNTKKFYTDHITECHNAAT